MLTMPHKKVLSYSEIQQILYKVDHPGPSKTARKKYNKIHSEDDLKSYQKKVLELEAKERIKPDSQRAYRISELYSCLDYYFRYTKPKKKNSYIKPRSKTEYAQELTRRMTTAERVLKEEIKHFGFLAQKVVLGFIPDFYNFQYRVSIELDGSVHNSPAQKYLDQQKDEIFRSKGIKVLRFTNDQVLNNLNDVVKQIKKLVTV